MSRTAAPELNTSSQADPMLGQLVEELTLQLQSGEPVDLEHYLAAHPAHAEALRRLLPAIEVLADLGAAGGAAEPRGARLADHPGIEPGAGALGDYQIIREIGRGGMGIVYEARQLSLNRRVALKVLPFAAALDHRQLQRFQVEAQAAAALHHTHIVPVFAVGVERGVHYYAMQFIDGRSMAEVIRELRRLNGLTPKDEERAAADRVSAELAEALASGQLAPAGSLPDGASPPPSPPPAPRAPAADPVRRGSPDPAATADPVRRGSPDHAATADSVRRGSPDPAATADRRSPVSGASFEPPALHKAAGLPPSSRGRAFFQAAARLGIQAAEALEYAHSLGVVHRDIKPPNLLLDTRGNLWLTDFGLAQVQAEGGLTLTLTGDVLGTLRYMSPEQALGRRALVDHRSDIYSLGVTLYELLTLRPAVGGTDRQELLRRIAFEEPAALRRHNPAVPRELETIVLKAMSKEPEGRYATAQELADDLRRFLEYKPIRARRPTVLERGAKWVRRHPGAMTTAVAALALVTSALAVTTVLVDRERAEVARQRNAAEAQRQRARAAVDTMYIRFAERWLAEQPRMTDVQREFLEEALRYYEEFARGPDFDADALRGVAAAHLHVGEIRAKLGHHREAEASYRTSLALWEQLTSGPAPSPEDLRRAAVTALKLGNQLQALGPLEEAEALYRRSLGLASRLPSGPGARPEYLTARAGALGNIGFLQSAEGRSTEAEASYRAALPVYEAALSAAPDEAKYRANLSNCLNNLGNLCLGAGRLADAEAAYRRAEGLFGDLARDFAGRSEAAETQAYILGNLAETLRRAGRPGEAEACVRRAVAVQERQVREFPDVPDYRNELAASLGNLAISLHAAGRIDEARDALGRVATILDDLVKAHPSVVEYRQHLVEFLRNRGNLLAEEGRFAEAAEAYRRAMALAEKNAADFRDRASLRVERSARWYQLIRFLTDCPDARVRDLSGAIRLARRAVADDPKQARLSEALGIALYRAGDLRQAVEALERSLSLEAGNSVAGLALAMTRWTLGDRDQARACYDRAVAWQKSSNRDAEETRRYREAAALLGLTDHPTRTGKKEENTKQRSTP